MYRAYEGGRGVGGELSGARRGFASKVRSHPLPQSPSLGSLILVLAVQGAMSSPAPSTSRLTSSSQAIAGGSTRKLPLGWETGQGRESGGSFFDDGGFHAVGDSDNASGGIPMQSSRKGKERITDEVESATNLAADVSHSFASPDSRPRKKPRYFDAAVSRPSSSAVANGRKSSTSPTRPKFLLNRQLLPPPRPPSPPARLRAAPQIGSHPTVLAKSTRGPAPLDLLFGGDEKPLTPFSWSRSSSFYSPKPEPPPARHLDLEPHQKVLFTHAVPAHKARLFPPQIHHPPRPRPPYQPAPFKPPEQVAAQSRTPEVVPKQEPADDLFEGDDSMSEPEAEKPDIQGLARPENGHEQEEVVAEKREEVEGNEASLQAVDERADEREGSPELFEGVSVSPQKPVFPPHDGIASTTRSASVADSIDSSRLSVASNKRRAFRRLSRATPVYYSDDSGSEIIVAASRQRTASVRSVSPDLAAPSAVRMEDHKVKIEPIRVKKVTKAVKEKKPQLRQPVKVKTEDAWWNIDPDAHLRHVEPPEGWLPASASTQAPSKTRPCATSDLSSLARLTFSLDRRTLEFTLHKVAVPASDIVASIFEDGEWFVGFEATLVAVEGDVPVVLSGHETELRLLLLPPPPSQPFLPTRNFVPDTNTTLAFPCDPSLVSTASELQLRCTFIDGSTRLPTTIPLTCDPKSWAPCHFAFAATEPGLTISLNVLPPESSLTLKAAYDVLARRLDRLAVEQDEMGGVWIPDPMAVRGHEEANLLPMPALSGERMGYDFAVSRDGAS